MRSGRVWVTFDGGEERTQPPSTSQTTRISSVYLFEPAFPQARFISLFQHCTRMRAHLHDTDICSLAQCLRPSFSALPSKGHQPRS